MKIDLPPDVEAFVIDLIAAGEVRSAEEAVSESVRRWKRQRDLREAIQEGLDDLDAGRSVNANELFERKREDLASRIAQEVD